MATLSDVAARAGVSLATASRVLNGSTHRTVRPQLRQRVLEAAAELGYVPNRAAQAMARGRTDVICLIVASIADPYFSSIAAGVSREAHSHGLRVTICEADGSDKSSLEVIDDASSQQAAALIVVGGTIPSTPVVRNALSQFMNRTGSPVLSIGTSDLPTETRGVEVDNRAAAADLAGMMLQFGYRDISVITAPAAVPASHLRAEGFTHIVRKAGGTVREIIETTLSRQGGIDAMNHILASATRPQLVFATADIMAVGALAAARTAGVVVPNDIALCGFDDIPTLADIVPSLTTVHIDLEELGRRATRLLVSPTEPIPTTMPTSIMIRESTPNLIISRA